MSDRVEFARAIAELLKAIAWPLSALVITTIVAPHLRSFFESLPDRDVEVKAPGFAARMSAVKQQDEGDNPVSSNVLIPDQTDKSSAPLATPRPAVAMIEANLQRELANTDQSTKEPILLRALAESRLLAGHEFTYNRIYGSQITALKRLNERGGATIEEARAFLVPYVDLYPNIYQNYTFDGWLGFLKTNALVEQINDFIQLTTFGQDFLVYLTTAKLPESKPG